MMVPASGLEAFAARDVADPPGPLAPNGTLVATPAGSRPYYCLESVSDVRSGFPLASAGIDYCKTAVGSQLLSARDSGKEFYVPFGAGKNLDLTIGTPIYRDGADPSSVDARQAAFVGWIGLQIRPSVLLASVLKGHQATALAFHFDGGSSSVTFKAGSAPSNAQTNSVGLANGWTVSVSAAVGGGGVWANQNSLFVLLGGFAVSCPVVLIDLRPGHQSIPRRGAGQQSHRSAQLPGLSRLSYGIAQSDPDSRSARPDDGEVAA